MQSGQEESSLNLTQKVIITFLLIIIIVSFIIFKNIFFKPTYLLKSFGELSINPEIAFKNTKPTFLEFYAEWCEVCKEMAPKISNLITEYGDDINFVLLNVDNPKWEEYIRKFNVNGIPQVNLFNKEGNLEVTFIGKQEESNMNEFLANLQSGIDIERETFSSESSLIREIKNSQGAPRSHS